MLENEVRLIPVHVSSSTLLTSYSSRCSDYGDTKNQSAIDHFTKFMQAMCEHHAMENEALEEMPTLEISATSAPKDGPKDNEKTWFTLAKEEVWSDICHIFALFNNMQATKAEDDKYSETKAKLHREICALRDRVLEMISTNESLPDIERLARQEFILDTDDYHRMLQEEEKLISSVREEVEFSNLAAMFLRDLIKRECWDKMMVKGRTIKVKGGCLTILQSVLGCLARVFRFTQRCTIILSCHGVRLL